MMGVRMHVIRWMMVLCCSWSVLFCEDDSGESVEPPPVLSQVMSQLSQAQERVQSSYAGVGVVVPSGLIDVLVVRRTIAADWQRRLTEGSISPKEPELVRFIAEQNRLKTHLQELVSFAEQLRNMSQQFPHCRDEVVFTRYRALIISGMDQGMKTLIAGRFNGQNQSAENYQRQSRYTALLTLIEAGYTQAERYAKLPRDDRQLAEYRDHLAQVRMTLEKNVDARTDDASDRQQNLLGAYTAVLDARMKAINEVTESGVEAGAPEVMTYHRASDALIQILNQRLVKEQNDKGDPPTSDDPEERMKIRKQAFVEERAYAKAERLLSMAGQWLSSERTYRTQMKEYAEQVAEVSTASVESHRAAMAVYTQKHKVVQSAFDQAIKMGDENAALIAQQSLEQISQQCDQYLEHLTEDIAIAEREKTWRAHAKDPMMAERLREWDKRRAAMLAARRSIAEAADRALSAKHASELAEWSAQQAQEQVEEVKETVEEQDQGLEELMQALDEIVEQKEDNP
jgi:hypothetical protein